MNEIWELVGILTVKGEPVAQPRPRAYVRPNGKAGTYDNGRARGWKREIQLAAARAKLPRRLVGPIRLEINFFLGRPARLKTKSSPAEPIPHTNVPDIDNLTKAVMDALNEYGLWRDDRQVAELCAYKRYAELTEHGESRCALIEIRKQEAAAC